MERTHTNFQGENPRFPIVFLKRFGSPRLWGGGLGEGFCDEKKHQPPCCWTQGWAQVVQQLSHGWIFYEHEYMRVISAKQTLPCKQKLICQYVILLNTFDTSYETPQHSPKAFGKITSSSFYLAVGTFSIRHVCATCGVSSQILFPKSWCELSQWHSIRKPLCGRRWSYFSKHFPNQTRARKTKPPLGSS